MQDVYAVYEELYADENVTCLIQESAMREQEREAFLEAFAKDNEKSMVVVYHGRHFLGGN